MDLWHLLLYAVASILALRSLVSLMTHHKRQYQKQLQAEAALRTLEETADETADGAESQDQPKEAQPAETSEAAA